MVNWRKWEEFEAIKWKYNMLWKEQEMVLIFNTQKAVFIGLFGGINILRCFGIRMRLRKRQFGTLLVFCTFECVSRCNTRKIGLLKRPLTFRNRIRTPRLLRILIPPNNPMNLTAFWVLGINTISSPSKAYYVSILSPRIPLSPSLQLGISLCLFYSCMCESLGIKGMKHVVFLRWKNGVYKCALLRRQSNENYFFCYF